MYIQWKPLFLLGFAFWTIAYSRDPLNFIEKNFGDIQKYLSLITIRPEPPPIYVSSKKYIPDPSNLSSVVQTPLQEKPKSKVGLSILIANVIIFFFSIFFCFFAKFFTAIIYRGFNIKSPCCTKSENLETPTPEIVDNAKSLNATATLEIEDKADIPKASSTPEVEKKQAEIEESVCPVVKTKSHQSCQTLYHAPVSTKTDINLRVECAKLKEELTCLQATSLKEHAVLSRRLESIARDKKELAKRFTIVQKENQVAKNQLDELMEEKQKLQKRLESSTKEFRINTRTKKIALAKLEDISATVEDLKRQLEQVTRDKQIVQAKLEVMRNEYEKMQERLGIMKLKEANKMIEVEEAEKDVSGDEVKKNESSVCVSSQCSLDQNHSKESVFLPYVLSQTEVDVKKIQMKIFQLESTLKEFNSKSSKEDIRQMDARKTGSTSAEEEKLTNLIPPKRIISSNDVTCRKTYDEIQVESLRNTLREKIKSLEILREYGDESGAAGCVSEASTAEEECELSPGEAPRISKSKAFQNFMKTIGAETKIVTLGSEH